jgi:hypothetical protein
VNNELETLQKEMVVNLIGDILLEGHHEKLCLQAEI